MEKMLVSPSPQIRDNISTSKVMTHVLVALCPALAMSAYVFGGRALMLTGFCMITALIWERLCNLIMKRPDSTKDVSALVTGMLLAFNLPVTMPYWQAAIGTFVAIVIVKQLFGGLGQNFANPAIVGRIVLMLAFTGNMTHWVVPFYDPDNIVTGATPLAAAHSAPADYLDLFLGKVGGCLGEVSAAALLIGGIYLIMMKIISVHTPLAFIGTVFVFSYLCGEDGIYQILAGGVMLGAFFMATDYVTSPITPAGKALFGVILGILTFCFRIYGGSAEGVSYAIIFSNLLVPLIERWTQPKSFGEGAELAAQGDTAGTKSKMDTKSIVIATIAIMIITVIAGFALAYVYKITKDPIAVTEQKAKEEAYKAVFDDADSFDSYADFDADAAAKILSDAGYNADIDEIVEAKGSDGSALGYVVTVTSHEAYSGDLQLAMGVRADGTTNGISFLSLSETAGLGMEADTDSFKSQFSGKKVDKFQYTKSGATVDEEIDALSGATITTNAVTNAVNAGLEYVKSINGGAADSSAASNGGDK